jgi:hypothetical protein
MRIDCNSAGVHREMIAGIAGNVNLGTCNASELLCIGENSNDNSNRRGM